MWPRRSEPAVSVADVDVQLQATLHRLRVCRIAERSHPSTWGRGVGAVRELQDQLLDARLTLMGMGRDDYDRR